jgi:hypothetical protein
MEIIRARLREPSTWAGFSVLYVLIEGVLMGTTNWAAQAPALLLAVVAVIKGEVAKL